MKIYSICFLKVCYRSSEQLIWCAYISFVIIIFWPHHVLSKCHNWPFWQKRQTSLWWRIYAELLQSFSPIKPRPTTTTKSLVNSLYFDILLHSVIHHNKKENISHYLHFIVTLIYMTLSQILNNFKSSWSTFGEPLL